MKRAEGRMGINRTSDNEVAAAAAQSGKARLNDPKPEIWRRLLPLVAPVLALAIFFSLDLDRFMTIEALRENRMVLSQWVASNYYLTFALFILAYAGATAISIPGASIFTIFGGFLFGQWLGAATVIFAATAGALVIFTAARTSFGYRLRRRAVGFLAKMERGFRENELSYMFLVRLVPIFPFWGINIAAGLMNVRPRNFVIGTFFGMIPGAFVYVSIGHGLGSAFDAGGDVTLSGVLFRPETIIPILGLAALAAAPIVWKSSKRRNILQAMRRDDGKNPTAFTPIVSGRAIRAA